MYNELIFVDGACYKFSELWGVPLDDLVMLEYRSVSDDSILIGCFYLPERKLLTHTILPFDFPIELAFNLIHDKTYNNDVLEFTKGLLIENSKSFTVDFKHRYHYLVTAPSTFPKHN